MMKKVKKLKSSLKVKAKGIKHMESVLQAPSPDKEDLKIVGTDEVVLKEISDSFTNNVNVYRGVLSQAIDKHGHDLVKVKEHIKHLDGVSCDNYEPILREIDKYKKVSE